MAGTACVARTRRIQLKKSSLPDAPPFLRWGGASGEGVGVDMTGLSNNESKKALKKTTSPVVVTVVFAAAAAALLAAVAGLPLRFTLRPAASNAAILLCLASYAAYLTRLSGRGLRALFAPLFMLSAVLAVAGSVTGFAVPAAAGLAWVRSGICFPGPMPRRLWAEALTAAAGLGLIRLLVPPGPYGAALGIWLFGLAQALYFVMVDTERPGCPDEKGPDGISQAHRRAEALLREQRLARAFAELGL